MKKHILVIVFLTVWGGSVLPARSQWLATVSARDLMGHDRYVGYGAVACTGDNCIVAVRTVPDTLRGAGRIAFLRSTDGAHTWARQVPAFIDDTEAAIFRIDQVDSLNIVATGQYGDSSQFGLILRTSDGGTTWRQQFLPVSKRIKAVSFSDPKNGIVTIPSDTLGMFITSNGGDNWTGVPMPHIRIDDIHSYGHGTYRGYNWSNQIVYSTTDGWATVDSTNPIVPDSAERTHYAYQDCSFGSGDTMLAYGFRRLSLMEVRPCIARTADGGKHWSRVFYDSVSGGYISALSDVHRDTVLAGVTGWQNLALWSTDNGLTWKRDTLISNDTGFDGYQNDGIALNGEGELVGAFNGPFISGQSAHYSVVVARHVTSGVGRLTLDNHSVMVLPNPASTSVKIISQLAKCPLHVFDMLGREVAESYIPAAGTCVLDVSQLPRGIYLLVLEVGGSMVPVTRLSLVAD